MTAFDDIVKEIAVDVLPPGQDALPKEMEGITRSFISDTITAPTQSMFAYAVKASVGDDVYNGDYSTDHLEQHVAKIAGKEGALFMPTGTMSNQVALRTHLTQPPFSVLCDHRAHVYKFEGGGISFHSQATVIPVPPTNHHHLTLEDVKNNVIQGDNVHIAPTTVISLENTLNGTIFPQDEIVKISEWAKAQDPPIKMHCDGARLWHVAAEKSLHLKTLCDPFDSVSLCLSKGIGAPIGTVLVGNAAFIKRARWFRKIFGGGMRQTGSLAACAAYSLTNNFKLLPSVHALARHLEAELKNLGVTILSSAETCMVLYDATPIGLTYAQITEAAAKYDPPVTLDGSSRLVLHYQTSPGAVDDLIKVIANLKSNHSNPSVAAAAPKAVANGQPHPAHSYYQTYQRDPSVSLS